MITPERIRELIRRPDPVILDIGCNDGEHTHMFLNLFPEGRVFSFEPDPRAQCRFLANAHPRARLFPFALGAEEGVVDFYPSEGLPAPLPEAEAKAVANRLGAGGWDYSGSIRRPKLHLKHYPWCKFGQPIRVPITTLDNWAADFLVYQIDFIWADVQGAEMDLIKGGSAALQRTKFFYTEYSNHELYEGQSTLEQIQASLPNFEVAEIFPDDVLLRSKS